MKAKHFKKLRANVQYYRVRETPSLFGFIFNPFKEDIGHIVIARSPEEAVNRLRKRQHLCKFPYYKTDMDWAKYAVQPVAKPFQRHISYWK